MLKVLQLFPVLLRQRPTIFEIMNHILFYRKSKDLESGVNLKSNINSRLMIITFMAECFLYNQIFIFR